jgi:hypothetical protein
MSTLKIRFIISGKQTDLELFTHSLCVQTHHPLDCVHVKIKLIRYGIGLEKLNCTGQRKACHPFLIKEYTSSV